MYSISSEKQKGMHSKICFLKSGTKKARVKEMTPYNCLNKWHSSFWSSLVLGCLECEPIKCTFRKIFVMLEHFSPSDLPPVGHCSFCFQVYLLWMLVWVMVFVNHGLWRSSLSQRNWNFRVVWDSLQLNCLQVLLVKYIDTAPGFSLLVSKLSQAVLIWDTHPWVC